ncbi:metal ABC transporter substrate-binding protein [Natrialbaceae archaeon A-chndr2]
MKCTRRNVLQRGGAAAAIGALAGCLSEPNADGSNDDSGTNNEDGAGDLTGYASFFALWDWAGEITGEHGTFENPVDVGEMGHGWTPEGDLVRNVAETDAFVYLDTPEFSWAQDLAAQLEAESVDVATIDGLAGFTDDQLLSFSDGSLPDPDPEYTVDPADFTLEEFQVIDPTTNEVTAYWHIDHWDGGLPNVPLEGAVRFEPFVEADGGHVVPVGPDEQLQVDVRLDDGAPEGIVDLESDGNTVEITGLEEGRTLLVFELHHDGSVIWDSSAGALSIDVSADVDPADVTEFHDPHVWADPVLATQIVETFAREFATLDPDNAATYEANAKAYAQRLEGVDEGFQSAVADGELDIAVFAGHDSFRYVEHRYGFDLHSPVGVSPDESPSSGEITATIELVDEHGIDTILYDPFEATNEEIPPLAQTIVENSSATETAPMTPAEGTLAEWHEQGWGWIEQMEEVTIPSLRKALKAD